MMFVLSNFAICSLTLENCFRIVQVGFLATHISTGRNNLAVIFFLTKCVVIGFFTSDLRLIHLMLARYNSMSGFRVETCDIVGSFLSVLTKL